MSIGLPSSSGTFISIAKRRMRTKPIWANADARQGKEELEKAKQRKLPKF